MYMLIYVSSAVKVFSDAELVALLEKSRNNNAAVDVTGMLLYRDGNFMQLLEGPEKAVKTLADKIRLDPRHRGVLTLLQQEKAQREFAEWQMGFQNLDKKAARLSGQTDFMDSPFDSDEFQQTPSKALKLLLNFKRVVP